MTQDLSTDPAERGDDVWTLPNVLSMLRLAGVPVFLWAILTGHDGIALATLILVWVLVMSWPQLTPPEKLLRLAVIALLAAVTVVRALPR